MRVLEAFETSRELTEKGRPCEIEFGGKVICVVQIRPADVLLNADYRAAISELAEGLKRVDGEIEISADEDQERLYRLYCRAVITGWEWTDPADAKDKTLSFNEKNAVALFAKAPKFFEAIQIAARAWGNFRSEHEEAAIKN